MARKATPIPEATLSKILENECASLSFVDMAATIQLLLIDGRIKSSDLRTAKLAAVKLFAVALDEEISGRIEI